MTGGSQGRGRTGNRPAWLRRGMLAVALAFACLLAFSTGVARADGTGSISGTVTDQGSNPLANISVSVYPYGYAGGSATGTATTGADGTYTIANLPAGTYFVEFNDPTGTYAEQVYDGQAVGSSIDWVTVTAGTTTPHIDAQLALGGKVSGTVTDGNGIPLPSMYVYVAFAGGAGLIGGDSTNVNGSYTIGGLAPGSYNVYFDDFSARYSPQWYDGQADQAGAAVVTVSGGRTLFNVDATLQPAPGAVIGPMNAVLPAVTGSAAVGQTLACSSGTWSGDPTPSCTYQWLRDGSRIDAATSAAYLVQEADCGHTLSCQVTATNSGGAAIAGSQDVAVSAAPSLCLKVSRHTVAVGGTVTMTGSVKHALATARTVTICRKVCGKLTALKHLTLSKSGTFRWQMKVRRVGRWVLVVSYKAAGLTFSAKAVVVTVRR